MTIKAYKLAVRKDELQTTELTVPAWELPILQAIYTEEAVSLVGETQRPDVPPDAVTEFARLERRYRQMQNEDGSKGPHYVQAVYGQLALGQANLRRAIEEATVKDADALV